MPLHADVVVSRCAIVEGGCLIISRRNYFVYGAVVVKVDVVFVVRLVGNVDRHLIASTGVDIEGRWAVGVYCNYDIIGSVDRALVTYTKLVGTWFCIRGLNQVLTAGSWSTLAQRKGGIVLHETRTAGRTSAIAAEICIGDVDGERNATANLIHLKSAEPTGIGLRSGSKPYDEKPNDKKCLPHYSNLNAFKNFSAPTRSLCKKRSFSINGTC